MHIDKVSHAPKLILRLVSVDKNTEASMELERTAGCDLCKLYPQIITRSDWRQRKNRTLSYLLRAHRERIVVWIVKD